MDLTMDVIAVAAVVVPTLVGLLRPTWIVRGIHHGLAVGLVCAKWLMVIGLVAGFSCNPVVYRATGWTPLSVLVGDQVYRLSSANRADDRSAKPRSRR